MTRPKTHPLAVALIALWMMSATAIAGPGHDGDHDHDHPPGTPGTPQLPRFIAQSELFELVGVLQGQQITLYLDETDTNTPLREARIELEIEGQTLRAQKQGEAEFIVTLPAALSGRVIPVTATIEAAGQTDLLAGELDLAIAAQPQHPPSPPRWPLIPAGLAVLAMGWMIVKKTRAAAFRGKAGVK